MMINNEEKPESILLESEEGQKYLEHLGDVVYKTILYIKKETEGQISSEIDWDRLMIPTYKFFAEEFLRNNLLIHIENSKDGKFS